MKNLLFPLLNQTQPSGQLESIRTNAPLNEVVTMCFQGTEKADVPVLEDPLHN